MLNSTQVKARIQENVPLAPLTTFGIGGPARYFINAASQAAVLDGLDFANSQNLPLFVLGGGSNILVADEGFEGLVLKIDLKGMQFDEADADTEIVRVGAGEEWDPLVQLCVERKLAGIECLSGIPGSVGGTPVQNVGAYGQEVSEVFSNLRAVDRNSGNVVELSHADCAFSYRKSLFNTVAKGRYIVLEVTYKLSRYGEPAVRYADVQKEFEGTRKQPTLAEVRNVVRRIRARKAMLLVEGDPDCRSAGSFFKNPILSEDQFARLESILPNERVPRYPASAGNVKTAAAWLIERAGFTKGYSLGPAGLSTKHTLAVVNKGGATAADVLRLAREIQKRVEQEFGVRLVPEPVFVGLPSW
jgi:UDP-N-acetylmuramate dehydrogenase